MSFTNSQYINWIDRCATALAAAQDELTALDTAIGDGDHGLNMHRGFSKAQEKLAAEADKDLGSLSKSVGMTLLSTVGGASGPLYGTFFIKAAPALNGKNEADLATLAQAIADGTAGLVARGQAAAGGSDHPAGREKRPRQLSRRTQRRPQRPGRGIQRLAVAMPG